MDFKKTIILAEKPEGFSESDMVTGSAKLVASPKMDDLTYKVHADRPAIMLSSGNFHRYWKATVNGKPAKVYKAFGTLRAVVVPAGESTVRLEYTSDAVRISLWIGLISLCIFVIAVGTVWVLKRKTKLQ